MLTKRDYIEKLPAAEIVSGEPSGEQRLVENIRRKRSLIRRIRKDVFSKIAVFTAALVITFTVVFGVDKAPTNDMYPAVRQGDIIIYYRLGSIVNSDVVVYEAGGERNIGRVQALSGSKVNRTEGGQLTIDGNLQPVQKRSGIFDRTFVKEEGKLPLPSTVPDGSFLVLADQRGSANDSRDHGYIGEDQIKGKVFTLIRRRLL